MTRTLNDYVREQLQDPEFASVHEELTPQYQVVRELLDLQEARGISAEELAKMVGVEAEELFTLENAGGALSLTMLYRVARALGARLEIHLQPLEAVAA